MHGKQTHDLTYSKLPKCTINKGAGKKNAAQ